MPMPRIERIVGGVVKGVPRKYANGLYRCHAAGQNMADEWFATLEEVADFLRKNPLGGVRMTPGYGKISENIFIDGSPR